MEHQFRRVVTGHNAKGEAIVVSDACSPFVDRNPFQTSVDYFRTDAIPARIPSRAVETTEGPRRQLPVSNGTVFRLNHFPPVPEFVNSVTPEDARRTFAALGNEKASTWGRGGRHPSSHRTETIDYAVVIEGEITMLLDHEDVVLRAGDVIVQCGTNHAWVNRSDRDALVAFVLIDGKYEPDLKDLFASVP